MTSRRGFCTLALVPAVLTAGSALAQDKKGTPPAAPAKGDAKASEKGGEERKVLIDNDKVLVTENRYKPGATSAVRERGVRVTRALTDGTFERTYADGKKEKIVWKAGDVKYQAKEKFINKNVGNADMVVYTVTLK